MPFVAMFLSGIVIHVIGSILERRDNARRERERHERVARRHL